jgi:aminopeptidase-like protein
MIILLPQILFNTIVAAFTFNAFYILVNVLPLYFVFKTVPSVTKVVEWLSLDEWEEKEMRMKLS